MDVYEAVTSRRAVRGFTDQPVSRAVLERVLSAAAWSPSGSNIQPWIIYVLTGAPLAELKTNAVERVSHGDPWDERQYEMYPPQWADIGMYLQTVMLLLRAEGLHSCPQMAWSQVRETVAEFLSPPDG